MTKFFDRFGGVRLAALAVVLVPVGLWAANVARSDTKTNCVAQRVQRLHTQQVQWIPAALTEVALCANLCSAIREL